METDDGGKLKGEASSMQSVDFSSSLFLCFTQLIGSSLPSVFAE